MFKTIQPYQTEGEKPGGGQQTGIRRVEDERTGAVRFADVNTIFMAPSKNAGMGKRSQQNYDVGLLWKTADIQAGQWANRISDTEGSDDYKFNLQIFPANRNAKNIFQGPTFEYDCGPYPPGSILDAYKVTKLVATVFFLDGVPPIDSQQVLDDIIYPKTVDLLRANGVVDPKNVYIEYHSPGYSNEKPTKWFIRYFEYFDADGKRLGNDADPAVFPMADAQGFLDSETNPFNPLKSVSLLFAAGRRISEVDGVREYRGVSGGEAEYHIDSQGYKIFDRIRTPGFIGIELDGTTAINDNIGKILPNSPTLMQNYPNPVRGEKTAIKYFLPKSGQTRLKVYDMLGREVANLLDQHAEAGQYGIVFDVKNLPSGTYLYRLEAGGETITKKMNVVK